jgi:hypothetical protein
VYRKAVKKKETVTKTTVHQFNPECPLTWAYARGLVYCLWQGGELDADDNLLNGAGSIVTSRVQREEAIDANAETHYEDSLNPDFFAEMAKWIRRTSLDDLFLEIDDLTGDDALLVLDFLELSLSMTSIERATALLAA